MRKLIEATDELNANKPLNIPTGEYGQYQGEPMETDYGKHPVDMTVQAKVPELKFLKILNKKFTDLEDLNHRLERKHGSDDKSPKELNKNMEKQKQADIDANGLADPEEKSVKWVEKEIVQKKSKEMEESYEENELHQTPLMKQKFDSDPNHDDELFDSRMRLMSEKENSVDSLPLEAWGVMKVKSNTWRKKFKNQAEYEKWFEKNKDNIEVYGTRIFYNESHAFKDWSPRSTDDISPTAVALDRAIKMFRAGQKIEDIASNVGMPAYRLRILLRPYLAKASLEVNKQDKYTSMASKYGVNEEISKLRRLSGLK